MISIKTILLVCVLASSPVAEMEISDWDDFFGSVLDLYSQTTDKALGLSLEKLLGTLANKSRVGIPLISSYL